MKRAAGTLDLAGAADGPSRALPGSAGGTNVEKYTEGLVEGMTLRARDAGGGKMPGLSYARGRARRKRMLWLRVRMESRPP
jgi:hypothetical protein